MNWVLALILTAMLALSAGMGSSTDGDTVIQPVLDQEVEMIVDDPSPF